MPEDHGSAPVPSHSKACHTHGAVQTMTFPLYSSSKAKMKNGSFSRAGEKLIALNQMEKVVVCLGLCWVYLWKETGADHFENITRQKINFLLIKCFGRSLLSQWVFIAALINVVFCLWSCGWLELCCAPALWDWSSGPPKAMSKLLCSLSPSLGTHKGLSVPSPVQEARKNCLIYFPTTDCN